MWQSSKLNFRSRRECQPGGILAKIRYVENDWTARGIFTGNRANKSAVEWRAINANDASNLDGKTTVSRRLSAAGKMRVEANQLLVWRDLNPEFDALGG